MYYSGIFLVAITLLLTSQESTSCSTEFHGFGVHLGSLVHFNETNEETIQNVIDVLYHDLKIRHFRTSYEPYFSPSKGVYDLTCHDVTCTWAWESILKILSNQTRYPDHTLFASVWSPPYYMKDLELVRLKPEYELDYYYYLKNITQLVQERFGLTVEQVSPVNEPENIFAPWDHCNMDPAQLCRMVTDFNDPLISMCPENSYYWITQIFMKFNNSQTNCLESCRSVATHSYSLNVNASSENFGLAAYDLKPYENTFEGKPVWMTEVSSTFHGAREHQMEEGLDFAMNIVNFLGTTCVERYYFWIAYTNGASGESLIWGQDGKLQFPKKYYIYNHFTNASSISSANGPIRITTCTPGEISNSVSETSAHCLHFDSTTTVFVNTEPRIVPLEETADCGCGLCCTTETEDNSCNFNTRELPAKSVCTCRSGCGYGINGTTGKKAPSHRLPSFVFGYFLIDNVLRYIL